MQNKEKIDAINYCDQFKSILLIKLYKNLIINIKKCFTNFVN